MTLEKVLLPVFLSTEFGAGKLNDQRENFTFFIYIPCKSLI
jgi:hypothetical protein